MQFPPSKKPQLTTLSHKCNTPQADVCGGTQDGSGFCRGTEALQEVKFELDFEG